MSYRVVAVTPAGRRRYMRLLAPYLLSSNTIDRYDIWVNTTDPLDLAFLEALSEHEKVRLITQPDGVVSGNSSINAFFKFAQSTGEIYIRFDDDIVWIERDAIERIIEFRLANMEYFLVSPYVINNAMCSALLQLHGKLLEFPRVKPYCMDAEGWASPEFAEKLHRTFLAALSLGDVAGFRGKDAKFAAGRFSINCISWFGKDLQPFDQIFEGDEEEQISFSIPALANRCNSLVGRALVAHFSFFTQRELLDQTDLLERYREVQGGTNWLKPDAIRFVETAYATVSEGDVGCRLNGSIVRHVSQNKISFVDRAFYLPVGIKTKRTSVARVAHKILGR